MKEKQQLRRERSNSFFPESNRDLIDLYLLFIYLIRFSMALTSPLQDVKLGINAVTRAMESHKSASKDATWQVGALVVANRGVRPPALLQHTLVMAASR